jgi:alpha-beta hydrolase superfamily lysophospholipase
VRVFKFSDQPTIEQEVSVGQHVEGKWQSADGTQRYAQWWLPDGEPQASVVIVHGLGEHSQRYQHVAEFFNQHGIALLAYDLRGHGRSEGTRGDVTSFDAASQDVTQALEQAQRIAPGAPQFIYGHSLGGALSLYYLFNCKPQITGMVVTAPGLSTEEPVPAWKMTLGKILAKISPSTPMDNGLDFDSLCSDPVIVERYRTDPLVHPKITAGFGVDLINQGEWIRGMKHSPLPLLIMQGTGDHVIAAQTNIAFAENLEGNVTLKVWKDFCHELHNEPQWQEVLNYVMGWMHAQMAALDPENARP